MTHIAPVHETGPHAHEPEPPLPVNVVQPPTGDADIDQQVRDLVKRWGCDHSPELIAEMIGTVLKMAQDRMSLADLKMYNRSLKELRYSSRLFSHYRQIRKISIFGSARTPSDAPEALAAEAFAGRMCDEGYMIITGGGDGIMGAAQRGAGRERSFGLNIRLPFEQSANVTIEGDPKLVNFNYFFTRKLNFMKESHAIALFPGGFGTMDEGFEALTLLQTGKAKPIPLVLVDRPDGHYWRTWYDFSRDHLLKLGLISEEDFYLFRITTDIEAAVTEVLNFYQVYQSSRYVGQQMIIRLAHRLTAESLSKINDAFADLLRTGRFVQGTALRQERNEPEIAHLPRLIFTPHLRNFGRLRLLIDHINASEVEAESAGHR
jgi:uncharacterized protein (TIGR00730 family)